MRRRDHWRQRRSLAALSRAPSAAAGSATASARPLGGRATARSRSWSRYLTKGKLKVAASGSRYRVVCSADCKVTVARPWCCPGPNIDPVDVDRLASPAGQVFEAVHRSSNGPRLQAIKENKGKAKLLDHDHGHRPRRPATTDIDKRTFRFK